MEAIQTIMDTFRTNVECDSVTKAWAELYTRQRTGIMELKRGKTAPREHEFLMEHQRLCKDIADRTARYGFFLDTGTGKTLTALAIIDEHPDEKWLILCPKSIIITAWVEDQMDFFPTMKLLPLSRDMRKSDYVEIAERWKLPVAFKTVAQLKAMLIENAKAIVTNPESFRVDVKQYVEAGMTSIIMDESSMIKNPTSQITKVFVKYVKTLHRVYLLSGKPAPNDETEYFSQILAINPAIFGTSYTRFKERFFVKSGYMGYDWSLRPGADEAIADCLDECSIVIKKEDCLDLPEKTYIRRMVELSPKALSYYRDMEKKQLLLLQDKEIAAPHRMTVVMKLRQITSGFIIDTENAVTERLHSAKLNELAAVVDELGENNAIIWINFKEEIREISEMLEKKGKTFVIAAGGANVNDSIKAFKSNEAQFIIAHPKTLKYGVTFTGKSMTRNCTYAIYYSLSFSYEDYYQSHDRIYRKGQDEKCTFIFLLVNNSVDTDMDLTIGTKHKKTEVIENFMRRMEE